MVKALVKLKKSGPARHLPPGACGNRLKRPKVRLKMTDLDRISSRYRYRYRYPPRSRRNWTRRPALRRIWISPPCRLRLETLHRWGDLLEQRPALKEPTGMPISHKPDADPSTSCCSPSLNDWLDLAEVTTRLRMQTKRRQRAHLISSCFPVYR